MFLRDYAPEVLTNLNRGLALVTTRVSCEYLAEISAFDELVIRMSLGSLKQNRITMLFDYWRRTRAGDELVAHGEQEIACMQREGKQMLPTPVPEILRQALKPFADT
jgi:enediyne biosynthesis thioesterase